MINIKSYRLFYLINVITFVVIMLLVNTINLFSNKIIPYKIKWNDKIQKIDLINLNSVNYISISKLSKLFNEESNTVDYQIIYGNEKLKFANGSFYCIYEHNSNLRVSQMTMPVMIINSEIHIPFEAFLISFSGIKLIRYEQNNMQISVYTDIFFKTNHTKDFFSIIEESKIKTKSVKITDSKKSTNNNFDNKIVDDSISLPSKYYVPINLKK